MNIRNLLDQVIATTMDGRYEEALLMWSRHNGCTVESCAIKSSEGVCSHACVLPRLLHLSITYDRDRTFKAYKLLKDYSQSAHYKIIERNSVPSKKCKSCNTVKASLVAGSESLVHHYCTVDVATDEFVEAGEGTRLPDLEGTCDRWTDRIAAISRKKKERESQVKIPVFDEQPSISADTPTFSLDRKPIS